MNGYRQMAETAGAMLAEFGQSAVFERSVAGPYDTAAGRPGAARILRWTTAAVRDEDASGAAGGTLVEADEMRLLVAAGTAAPAPGDRVSLADGTSGLVKAVQAFRPAGETLYFTVTVKR